MKKLIAIITVLTILFNFAIYANNVTSMKMTDEQMEVLTNAGFNDEEISSMERQIEINNLSDEQISNYIYSTAERYRSLVENGYDPIDYPETISGDTITTMGIIPKHNISNNVSVQKLISDDIVTDITDEVDPGDNTGVYYLVESNDGYDQMTSFVTLPTVRNVYSEDRPFVMFGVSSSNGSNSMYGDIGLVYFPALGTWKGFYNFVESDSTSHRQNYEFEFNGGNNLYYHLTVSTSSVTLNVINANTWTSCAFIEYDFHTNCVSNNKSRVKIAKQITLAQHHGSNDSLNITTGTKMTAAKFSQTHLYLTNQYDYDFTSAYCSKAIRKGPTKAALKKVTYDKTAWTSDTVSISFN